MNSFRTLTGREQRPFLNRKYPDFESLDRQLSRRTLSEMLGELFRRFNFQSLLHPFASGHTANFATPHLENGGPSESEAIEVLAVGNCTVDDRTYHSLRATRSFRLCETSDLRTLWLIPKEQSIHVIVLHSTLSPEQLSEAARLARQRWPLARILVIRAGEEFLEDALYDDRVSPAVTPDTLIATIELLALNSRNRRSRYESR